MLAAAWFAALLAGPTPAQAQSCGYPDVIWCATLTVGETEPGAVTGSLGFALNAGIGALSDDDFAYDGTTYRVDALFTDKSRLPTLFFRLDPRGEMEFLDDAAFTLHVGTHAVSFAAAGFSDGVFYWADIGLSRWSDGDTVDAKLVYTGNATGKPVIRGTPAEGARLRVNLDGVVDPDGGPLTNINIAWYYVDPSTGAEATVFSRDGSDNYGVGHWYEPVEADVGYQLKVGVGFKDREGNWERVESDATPVVVERPDIILRRLDVTEPANGTTNTGMTVSLSTTWHKPIRMNYRFEDGTAEVGAGKDALGVSHPNVLIFGPGDTEETIPVRINGGTSDETNDDAAFEEFYVCIPQETVSARILGTLEVVGHTVRSGNACQRVVIENDRVPTLAGAAVFPSGRVIVLTFSEEIRNRGSDFLPDSVRNAFTLTADGSNVDISGIQRHSSLDHVLHINLTNANRIRQGDTVTLSYHRATAGDDALEDEGLNKVQSFTDFSVTNNSDQPRSVGGNVSITPKAQPRSADGWAVTEGSPAVFSLSRGGDTAEGLTVDVSVTESGSMLGGTPPSTVTFAAGSATAELSVATEDDKVAEPASVITATVSSGAGYTVNADGGSAAVTVEDDDTPLTASFVDVPGQHDGSGRFTFQVSFSAELGNGSGGKLRRALSVSGGAVKNVRRAAPPARDLYEVRVKPSGAARWRCRSRRRRVAEAPIRSARRTGGRCRTHRRQVSPARWASRSPTRGWTKAPGRCWPSW